MTACIQVHIRYVLVMSYHSGILTAQVTGSTSSQWLLPHRGRSALHSMSTLRAGKVLSLNDISAVKIVEISLGLDGTRASNVGTVSKIRQHLSSRHSILLCLCLAVLAYSYAKLPTEFWRCFNDSLS